MLEALGPVCDYFSLHHYSGEGGRGEYGPFASLRDFRAGLDAFLPTLRGFSMRKEPFNKWYRFPRREDDIKLAIDEWNIWNSTPRGEDNRFGVKMVYNWKDALWTSCMINTFVHYARDIGITNLAQMVNVLAPIMTDGDRSYVQTTYHVLMLYRKYLKGSLVECRFDAPKMRKGPAGELAMLDAAACQWEDGTLCLFLTNISKDENAQIVLPDAWRPLRSMRLRAPDFDDTNAVGREVVLETESEEQGRTVTVQSGTVCMVLMETVS